jgi:hypothetical protein
MVAMTRLSCHRFRANEVRLWLSVIEKNHAPGATPRIACAARCIAFSYAGTGFPAGYGSAARRISFCAGGG